MRKANVYRNNRLTGTLTEWDNRTYTFRYDDDYYADNDTPAVSLTMPKTSQEYHADEIFPFFFNMLSEGVNRKLQSRMLRIDEKDFFGLLIHTGSKETIGAVTVTHEQ